MSSCFTLFDPTGGGNPISTSILILWAPISTYFNSIRLWGYLNYDLLIKHIEELRNNYNEFLFHPF